MAYSEELAARVRSQLSNRTGFRERRMFGGIAFMVDGNMCCGVLGGELMARVGPDAYEEALAKPHAREMDLTGRALKGMVYVSPAGVEQENDLGEWVGRSLAFVLTLPAK